uniref:Beta-microseminoprotein n=1 Tax=Cavia porcellus TaxID=10141 RepID=A0A286XYR5_CAVPO
MKSKWKLFPNKKALLGSLLLLATFVIPCSAQCYFIPLERSLDGSPDECKDSDGTTHLMNSKWMTNNCVECTCGTDGISCCNIVSIPVEYDKDKCQSYFHKENCTYIVVERENPGKPCNVDVWIQ